MLIRSSDNQLGDERIELIYLTLLAFAVILVLWLELNAATLGILLPHAFLLTRWFLYALLGATLAHFLKAVQFSERIVLVALSAIFIAVGPTIIAFPGRLALVAYTITAASAVTYLYMLVAGGRQPQRNRQDRCARLANCNEHFRFWELH